MTDLIGRVVRFKGTDYTYLILYQTGDYVRVLSGPYGQDYVATVDINNDCWELCDG